MLLPTPDTLAISTATSTLAPGQPAPIATISHRDSLTGLFTQEFFCSQLDQYISHRSYVDSDLTLALLQLDNFYEIRNWVGKSEANLLLGEFARLLEKIVPDNSLLCRCKNHEFALLLVNAGSSVKATIGEKIRHATQKALGHAIPPQLSFSFGIGFCTVDAMTPDAEVVFAKARHRMSRRLAPQENSFAVADTPPLDGGAMLLQLRKAMEQDRLQLCYQAIQGLHDHAPPHYELRLRMQDHAGLIDAAQFIDIAVQNALGEALDCWVLGQALAALQSTTGRDIHLTVNLSLNSLVSSTFLSWLETRLQSSSAVPSQLVLQASEIDILIAQHHLDFFCQALQKLGLPFAVTHFGCTRNPLRYLSLLQAQRVKLDPSLVERLEADFDKRRELQQLVSMLHERGLQVVVGRIESVHLLPHLWHAGIDLVQGNCLHHLSPTRNFEFNEEIELRKS